MFKKSFKILSTIFLLCKSTNSSYRSNVREAAMNNKGREWYPQARSLRLDSYPDSGGVNQNLAYICTLVISPLGIYLKEFSLRM